MSDAAKDGLADEGYDPIYGARPLKRVVQNQLQNQLATKLLKGDITNGDTAQIDFDGERFIFKSLPTVEASLIN